MNNTPFKHSHLKSRKQQPLAVAIVGMACRFPGAPDLARFWANILDGLDATSDVPPDRWDPSIFFDPESTDNDRVSCKRGGYLDTPIPFDAAAHGIMPLTVAGGEPEQFLVLDAARAALADAGLPDGLADGRRVEVVVGRGNYFNRGNLTRLQHGRIVAQTLAILQHLHPEWTADDLDAVRHALKSSLPPFGPATIAGQVTNATAGRVANRLNLLGASFNVDAASASSLVALDLGVRALREGRADLALVGGVYLQSDVDFPMVFTQLNALSRAGQARPFARDADGALPGEGVGVVVLKRLADAERDGDRVYAIVQGVGLSSDGKGSGMASPNAKGHVRAIRRAYRHARIDPSTIGLIEGHGLGVPVSDRAELRALRAVFPPSKHRTLGAVSSMIGHAMPASGIAGLIKTALALHHRVLPPTLHAESPHPLLIDEHAPCVLNSGARPWVHGEESHPRRAGVNAFGFAGINAHAILEEHPASADGETPGCMPIWETEAILLGAPDRDTWLNLARALLDWLDRGPDAPLKDVAFTLNTGQPSYPFRVGLVVHSLDDLKTRLNALIPVLADPTCQRVRDARGAYFWDGPAPGPGTLAFLFPGEGSQYPGMLADLCPHFPEVRAQFDAADRVAIEHGHACRPSDLLFGGSEGQGLWAMGSAITVVLAAQRAFYDLFKKLGLRPNAVMGHSSGEFLALAAAGALHMDRAFEDRVGALGTTFERLDAAGDVPNARLLAVAADRDRVEAACQAAGGLATVAIDNCPHQVVLSGPSVTVDAVADSLRNQGIMCDPLPFERAYHTPSFAPALGPIQTFFSNLALNRPRIPLYSCAIAGKVPDDPEAVRALAVEQWARPVLFRQTIEAMHADGLRVFVEVGARGGLTGFVEDVLRGKDALAVAANLPRRSGLTQLNHLVAMLFARGVPLRPDHLYARRRPLRVDFEAEIQRPKPAPALAVGFPELRLSDRLAQSLRIRHSPVEMSPSQNAHSSSPSNGHVTGNGHAPNTLDDLIHLTAELGESDAQADEAMLAYLKTMNEFLETQQDVMSAYYRSQVNVAGPSSNGHHPQPPTSSAPIDHRSAIPEPTVHERADPPLPTAERALIGLVAERTGYPVEMLGLDLDMEADLGIDSIKRVEVLGDLQTLGYVPEGLDLDRLTHCRTLRQVVELLEPKPGQTATVGPWVGEIQTLIPGHELISTRLLDRRDDPVAEHHTLGGRKVSALDPDRKGLPVLPFTVMAEMLAQAAAVLRPDQTLKALRDVRAHRWIRYEDEPVTLEIHAKADPERPDEVRVEIVNLGNAQTPRTRSDGPVVDGTVVFGQSRADAPEPIEIDRERAAPCRFDAEELYRDQWLFHGPALQALIQVGPTSPVGIEGVLRVLPRRALLRETDAGGLLTDAIILDSFTHLLGCWGLDQMSEGDVMFPLRLAELTFHGDDPGEGAEIACRIAIQATERHRVRVDADLIGPSGQVWMRLNGWEDWRFFWPGRYRDVFRQPDTVLIGERLELSNPALAAVWLEPPADMGRPVWRDVLEWTQLDPVERDAILGNGRPDSLRSQRLWALIAAKEAVRRLWLDQGGAPVYPADLVIEHDSQARPFIRSRLEPNRTEFPDISIAHADGVAVALAASDPETRVGVDVERIEPQGEDFETVTMSAAEQSLIEQRSSSPHSRPEWLARVRCARRAAARATGLDDQGSNFEVIDADANTGTTLVQFKPSIAGRSFDPIHIPTARRGEYIWAWAQAGRLES